MQCENYIPTAYDPKSQRVLAHRCNADSHLKYEEVIDGKSTVMHFCFECYQLRYGDES